MKYALLALFCVYSFTALAEDRGARFQNLDQMIEALNLRPYFKGSAEPERKLKVAIFDNGFKDAQDQIGVSLPSNTVIHAGPVPITGEEEVHGFYMAKIFWSLLSLGGTDQRYAPTEFHLYNTYGYSNFKAAIDEVIASQFDLVLYSQTWEYGGNFDGRGFINTQVNRATDAGILWINNSGNFGKTTFNTGIKTVADDWVKLPSQNQSVEIRCEKDPCKLRAVLSWNDFSDDVEQGTDKDLDFILTDDTLSIIQSSNLTQQPNPPADQPGFSKYPREIISADLQKGLYFLRVKNRSKNFGSNDKLRITVSGDFITMANFDENESLLPPGDNANVITVGALDSDRSGISRKWKKPELWTNSTVELSSSEKYLGTSNSAAMVAAGSAILMSRDSSVGKRQIIARASSKNYSGGAVGRGLPLEDLGFRPTGPGCFLPADSSNVPDHVRYALNFGGTLVESNLGWKIFYPFDPIQLMPGMFRNRGDDLLVMTPGGPGIYARSGVFNLPGDFIEVLEVPQGQKICGGSGTIDPPLGNVFRLPKP